MHSLFLNNKYTTWYFNIITSRLSNKPEGYVERHHIVPKSLGGNNANQNIVTLTAREHYICHVLLIKMVAEFEKIKMVRALNVFKISSRKNPRNLTARQYENIRKLTVGNTTWNKGKTINDYTALQKENYAQSGIKKRGKPAAMKGKHFSKESAEAIRNAAKSPERKAKISNALKGRVSPTTGFVYPRTPCPHCGQLVAATTMALYHGSKCKSIKQLALP